MVMHPSVSRRRVLAVALLAAQPTSARPTPAQPGPTWGAAAGEDLPPVAFAGVTVPAGRARRLASVWLGGGEAACIAFAADLPEGERDLFVIAAGGRVVAIDVLTWRGTDGMRLSTRLSAVPDGSRLRLQRTASAPRGRATRWEAWTDYLAWRPGAAMVDAPVRPVLEGTWQAALSGQRRRGLALLADPPTCVSAALVAGLPAPQFEAGPGDLAT